MAHNACMVPRLTDILVLGAGLQGVGIALELARRGRRVTLVERDARALNRTSLRNEGKIHLGLIYANDPTLETAFLQLEGALTFRSIVSRWIPDRDWLELATPFHYLVALDSVLPAGRLQEHYAAVEQRCRERLEADPALDYLGLRPQRLVRPLTLGQLANHFDPASTAAGFATLERAIDTDRMAACLRHALARTRDVWFVPGHLARAIREDAHGFRVEGESDAGVWEVRANQVVNATWEQRLRFDAQLGIEPPANVVHRLKYRVIARVPPRLRSAPSVTRVLGRYGDAVIRRDGTAYLSWYPAGLRGWSHEVAPPAEWDAACRGEAPPEDARAIAAGILAGMDTWYPGIGRCEPLLVDAGAIVAIGRTDVDDAGSALHGRSRIGVQSRGGYHSVDPGKLTTAPRFAVETADRVEAYADTGRRAR